MRKAKKLPSACDEYSELASVPDFNRKFAEVKSSRFGGICFNIDSI